MYIEEKDKGDLVTSEGQGLSKSEAEKWKDLYSKIDISKVLNFVKGLNKIEYENMFYDNATGEGDGMLDKDGEWVRWDGSLRLSGVKRMIMNLFSEDRNKEVDWWQDSPKEVMDEVAKFNPKEFLK